MWSFLRSNFLFFLNTVCWANFNQREERLHYRRRIPISVARRGLGKALHTLLTRTFKKHSIQQNTNNSYKGFSTFSFFRLGRSYTPNVVSFTDHITHVLFSFSQLHNNNNIKEQLVWDTDKIVMYNYIHMSMLNFNLSAHCLISYFKLQSC